MLINGKRHKQIRTFHIITRELLLLVDWLTEASVTHVAMESTGVYWKPIFNLLEGHFEILVVNAQHIKAVPGRKTDVRDAEWIADLLQHGLLKGSFIPPAEQRELCELTRYRSNLVEERARAANRLQKTLEDTNIKLGDVATDILGKSSHAILEALLAGQTDPQVLAALARGRMRAKRTHLAEALVGTIKDRHRFLLREALKHIDTLDQAITRVGQEIAARMALLETLVEEKPVADKIVPEPIDGIESQPETQEEEALSWAQAILLLLRSLASVSVLPKSFSLRSDSI